MFDKYIYKTNNNGESIPYVSIYAREGYILRHKFIKDYYAQALTCELGMDAFWEEVLLDESQ